MIKIIYLVNTLAFLLHREYLRKHFSNYFVVYNRGKLEILTKHYEVALLCYKQHKNALLFRIIRADILPPATRRMHRTIHKAEQALENNCV